MYFRGLNVHQATLSLLYWMYKGSSSGMMCIHVTTTMYMTFVWAHVMLQDHRYICINDHDYVVTTTDPSSANGTQFYWMYLIALHQKIINSCSHFRSVKFTFQK